MYIQIYENKAVEIFVFVFILGFSFGSTIFVDESMRAYEITVINEVSLNSYMILRLSDVIKL